MSQETYYLISVILSALSMISVVLVFVQLALSTKQAKANHEEKRREKTVEYMLKWSESLEWETTFAINIIEQFNHIQCEKLYLREEFEVNYEIKEKLCCICSHYQKPTCKKCTQQKATEGSEKLTYMVGIEQCTELRWYVIKYLNHLESLLISWKQGIIDRNIIEEQFVYLYDPKTGQDTLQSFRNIAGNGASYPTIEEFCLALRTKRQASNAKMKELL